MITRYPKSSAKKWIKKLFFVGFVIEGGIFAVSYFWWRKVNHDRGIYITIILTIYPILYI